MKTMTRTVSVKPYLLFAGDNYYPSCGLGDYQGDFDTLEAASAEGLAAYKYANAYSSRQRQFDWYVVVEHATMLEIDRG